jgi:selenocysteine-specific elongation factor
MGTAGHVDHGKSTLVRALSGIDPDRLKEEKARGMTIDLGFAWMDLPHPAGTSESVGIVDVPGHIDFIKNMLAGIGGIDLVMLVVAADEGVMPQTREHLAIVDLLEAPAGVVVLTKVDAVDDPEWIDLVELDVAALVEGTRLNHAPVVRVSATTAEGLDALRDVLAHTLEGLPPRVDKAQPRLPVDRAFTLTGFGTVVTGTLLDGSLRVGDALELLPQGIPVRVRGLQTHKVAVEQGMPGSRLAINLTGVSATDVRRGDVLARPGVFRPTRLVDVRVRLTAEAPRPLKHNAVVNFYCGAAEIEARARVLGAEAISPGGEGWLQLRLDKPTVVAAGDRFILRLASPSVTLGGGRVVNPHPGKRWRRFDGDALARLEALQRGSPDELLLDFVRRQPFCGAKEAAEASGVNAGAAEERLGEMVVTGAILDVGNASDRLLVTREVWSKLIDSVVRALQSYHTQNPLRLGMARSELRSRLQGAVVGTTLGPRVYSGIVHRLQVEGVVEAYREKVWVAGRRVTLTDRQQVSVARTLQAFAANPVAPPNLPETMDLLGGESELLEMLLEDGCLLRLGGDVIFRREDVDLMMERVVEQLQQRGSLTLAEARDLLGTSRKYVQALLEEMDARRITRREGEARVLR